MGKTKVKRLNSLRPFFSFGSPNYSLLRKFNLKRYSPLLRILKGFTLIELIIVIGIIGILAGFILFTINPFTQLAKGRDAQRESDLRQLQVAADTFYNDTNCYPTELSETDLNENYINKIPNDPSGGSYLYIPDPSECPQWSIFMAKLSYEPTNKISCPLETLQNCVPSNYPTSGYNYCVISGEINCSDVNSIVISITPPPPGGTTSTNTPTPGGATSTNTPTPGGTTSTNTPTQTPTPPPPYTCCGQIWGKPPGSSSCDSINPVSQCDFAGGSIQCVQNQINGVCQYDKICTSHQQVCP